MPPKICHEVPLALLDISRQFNDYDYALVHLFDKYPKYFEFFEKSIAMGRRVILDNSIFELGKAFDADRFADWILRLKPQEYIVPDVLENTAGTIANFEKWKEKYGHLPGKKIGVVQGKNFEDLSVCYNFMHSNADKLAISFDYSYYLEIGEGENKWEKFARGRAKVLKWFTECGLLRFDKPHHLLGCALPQEYTYDPVYQQFETLDTSNPVVHGIMGVRYTHRGLQDKNDTKMVDIFEESVNPEQLGNVMYNVWWFRRFLSGQTTLDSIF